MNLGKIKKGLNSFCCWLLIVQLINLSIDPPRHQNLIEGKFTYQEDLSINKIESIYELITEHVFKINVPETQDATHHGTVKTFIVFYQSPAPFAQLLLLEKPIVHNHNYVMYIPDHFRVLESPPPQPYA